MKLRATAFQFLSRTTISDGHLGVCKCSPKQRPDIEYDLAFKIQDRPFEANFAQLPPARPSIGPFEYIDEEVDIYMSRRWPKCIALEGSITLTENKITPELSVQLLKFLRKILWTPLPSSIPEIYPPDQCATVRGYRREYFDRQMFDIAGNRRPNSREIYVPSEIGEPVGAGVADLPDIAVFDGINELVWSPILPFPSRKNPKEDLPAIRKAIVDLRKHYNSYNELQDAKRQIEKRPIRKGEIKAAVRAAASAVDAIIRYYGERWAVGRPPKNLPFDQKIEWLLKAAGRPSYRVVAAGYLDRILFLYRCRSTMHEGDCYYDDHGGARVHVHTIEQVRSFIEAVEDFVIWIDALA